MDGGVSHPYPITILLGTSNNPGRMRGSFHKGNIARLEKISRLGKIEGCRVSMSSYDETLLMRQHSRADLFFQRCLDSYRRNSHVHLDSAGCCSRDWCLPRWLRRPPGEGPPGQAVPGPGRAMPVGLHD